MEKIIVNVSWCDKNYGAALSENVPGAVVVTAKTYDELVDEVRDTLTFHIEGMVAVMPLLPLLAVCLVSINTSLATMQTALRNLVQNSADALLKVCIKSAENLLQ